MDGKAVFSHFEAKNLITTALPNQVTRPQGIGKGLVDSPVEISQRVILEPDGSCGCVVSKRL